MIKIENNEMGRACSAYGREECYSQGSGGGGESGGKKPLGNPGHRWKGNIIMDLREVGCRGVDWIELAQGRNRWRALVNAVMNLRVP